MAKKARGRLFRFLFSQTIAYIASLEVFFKAYSPLPYP